MYNVLFRTRNLGHLLDISKIVLPILRFITIYVAFCISSSSSHIYFLCVLFLLSFTLKCSRTMSRGPKQEINNGMHSVRIEVGQGLPGHICCLNFLVKNAITSTHAVASMLLLLASIIDTEKARS
jgi:hypothetical protein